MRPFVNLHNKIPVDMLWLAVALLAIGPLYPLQGYYGLLAWVSGLLFYRVCRIGQLKAVPLACHLNMIAFGLMLSLGQTFSLRLSMIAVIGAISVFILTTMFSRLLYHYWVPVLLFPALAVASACQNFWALAGPAPVFSRELFVLLAVCGLTGLVVSPVYMLLLLLGGALSFVSHAMVASAALASVVAILSHAVLFATCAGVLDTPSRRSLAWACLAVAVATICNQTLAAHQSVLAVILSANIGGLVATYGARIFSRYRYVSYRLRPEDKLEDHLTLWQRFRVGEARVGLPFTGTWKVSQSFDGEWTHRGAWKHGLDFIAVDELGKSFSGNGYELSDYYAFAKDVLAPTSGFVVALFDDFPDNPVGTVKNENNFGNYVIIRDAFGAHVLLGHLKQGSVACDLYEYVEVNQVIGQCGNSGYSPTPHIHMHVQADAVVGSATIPFHLSNYVVGNHFYFHGVPALDALVTKMEINTSLSQSLAFRVNQSLVLKSSNDHAADAVKLVNLLDPVSGLMYLTDGVSKLFHYRDALSFYFYRYQGREGGALYDLMTALPRVPLIFGLNCQFDDVAPRIKWRSKWQRLRALFQLFLTGEFTSAKASFNMDCDNLELHSDTHLAKAGLRTSVSLDPLEGFVKFTVGDRTYEVESESKDVVAHGVDVGVYSSGQKLRRVV